MEFKEAMRTWARMCETSPRCRECPIGKSASAACKTWVTANPIEAETILEKWAAEHPQKTIADDFFERCPNAMKDDMETPYACAKHCGYHAPTYCERIPQRCAECWRRPLEEVER